MNISVKQIENLKLMVKRLKIKCRLSLENEPVPT